MLERWVIRVTFSFHPRKAITTGEGGMITTNNDELAENPVNERSWCNYVIQNIMAQDLIY